MSALRPRAALVCAALLAGAPGLAHAQFGRLRDAAKAAARGAAGAEARPGRVTFTEHVLEITEARLAQLVRGLDAARAARPDAERRAAAALAAAEAAERSYPARLAAWERAHAAWDARRLAHAACAQRVADRHADQVEAERPGAERTAARIQAKMDGGLEAQVKALGERARAARARGDQAALAAIAAEGQRLMGALAPELNATNAMGQRLTADADAQRAELKTCGTPAPEPERPKPAGPADPNAAAREASEAGQRASGLTLMQYAVLLERVEEYVRLQGRTGGSGYRFTAAELAVLGAALEGLRGHATTLTGGAGWAAGAAAQW